MSRQPSENLRRYDYPEPLYLTPRSPYHEWSPPVSPMTHKLMPVPLLPWRSHSQSSLQAVQSPKHLEPGPRDSADCSRQENGSTHKRSVGKLRDGVDSGIGGISAANVVGEQGEKQPKSNKDSIQRPMADAVGDQATVSNELSNVFAFGYENAPQTSAVKFKAPPPQRQTKKRWSAHLWPAKTNGPASQTAEASGDVMEMPQRKRSRLDSVRRSVTDLGASIKQMAGKKRSRDEVEEPVAVERAVKFARIVAPEPPQIPVADIEPLWPDVTLPDVSWPPPAPPRCRPYSLELNDPEVQALINEVAAGAFAPRTNAATRESSRRYDTRWTRQEKLEFGSYVRAAIDARWAMDVD